MHEEQEKNTKVYATKRHKGSLCTQKQPGVYVVHPH